MNHPLNERIREIFLNFYAVGMTFKYPVRHLKEQLEKALLEEAMKYSPHRDEMAKLLRLKKSNTIHLLHKYGLLPSRKFYMKTCSQCKEKYVSYVNWKSPGYRCMKCTDNPPTAEEVARARRPKKKTLRSERDETLASSSDLSQSRQVLLSREVGVRDGIDCQKKAGIQETCRQSSKRKTLRAKQGMAG